MCKEYKSKMIETLIELPSLFYKKLNNMFFCKQNRQSYSYKSENILILFKSKQTDLFWIGIWLGVWLHKKFSYNHRLQRNIYWDMFDIIQLDIDGIDVFLSKNHFMKLCKINLNTTQKGF